MGISPHSSISQIIRHCHVQCQVYTKAIQICNGWVHACARGAAPLGGMVTACGVTHKTHACLTAVFTASHSCCSNGPGLSLPGRAFALATPVSRQL